MKKITIARLFLVCTSIIIATNLFSQKIDSTKADKGKFFANIYPGFNIRFDDKKPKAGFVLTTALLGYKRKLTDKVSGTIIFDVTRTTNNIQVTDSAGNPLNVSYFEGSKYTAFLKMAEIKWQFHKQFSLSVGQLLNTQYLTFQDKFWAHRYVEVTFQELNRFGVPADFGMRLNYQPSEKLSIYAGAFNGEGPFRKQDNESNFLLSTNIEYKPVNELMLKLYYGNQSPYEIDSLSTKNIYSAFVGFDMEKFRIGLEYDYIQNADYNGVDWSGFSGFAYRELNKQFEVFYRYDYISKSALYENVSYHILGVQYKPSKSFFMSTNYRYFSEGKASMIYLNFGLKF